MKLYKLNIILLLSGSVFLSGCIKKNFLDVNNDPNRVNDNNITPQLLFPQAAQAEGALLTGSFSNYVSYLYNWVGYYSVSGDFALPGNQTVYDIPANYPEVTWDNYYNTLYDLYLVQQKGLAQGDSVLAGAAMTLFAKASQELVDMFGDVP